MTTSTRRTKSRAAAACARLTALALCGCVMLPAESDSEARADAIGYVTVSTPTFTPITASANGDEALRFRTLRDELTLAEAVDAPSVGITQLAYEGLRAGLKASFSGDQLSQATRQSRGLTGSTTSARDAEGLVTSTSERRAQDEYSQERERTFRSPETPGAIESGDYLDTPQGVQERMWKVLERSGTDYGLSPATKAALVAAYKLQMVNMEEYYNLEGFSFRDRASTEFLPYKMHFTVTAEPGWYTRYHPYDAVAELTVGAAEDYRVLAVMPAETAQTLDQLTGSLRKLQLALDLEGAFQSVAVRGQLQYVREAVERLEGLRSQNATVVGFPAENKIRLRFRPATVPTDEQVDMQPVSRVFTALVLVRDKQASPCATAVKDGKAATTTKSLSVLSASRDFQQSSADDPSFARAVERLREGLAAVEASALALGDVPDVTPFKAGVLELAGIARIASLSTLAEQGGRSAAGTSAIQARASTLLGVTGAVKAMTPRPPRAIAAFEAALTTTREAAKELEDWRSNFRMSNVLDRDRVCRVSVASYFAAALRDEGGSWSPPTAPLRCFSHPVERHEASSACCLRDSPVPVWPGPAVKPFRIARAFGFYWTDAADAAAQLTLLQAPIAKVAGARGALDKAKAALQAGEAAAAASTEALDAARAALTEVAGRGGDCACATKAVELAAAELEAKKAAVPALKAKLTEAAASLAGAEAALGAARASTVAAVASAGKAGSAAVGYEVEASPRWLDEGDEVRKAAVWVRVAAAGGAPAGPFQLAGVGDVRGVVHVDSLDLSLALPVMAPGEYASGTWNVVRVFLEAVLVPRDAGFVEVDELGRVRARSSKGALDDEPPFQRTVLEVVLEPRAKVPGRPAAVGAHTSGPAAGD